MIGNWVNNWFGNWFGIEEVIPPLQGDTEIQLITFVDTKFDEESEVISSVLIPAQIQDELNITSIVYGNL